MLAHQREQEALAASLAAWQEAQGFTGNPWPQQVAAAASAAPAPFPPPGFGGYSGPPPPPPPVPVPATAVSSSLLALEWPEAYGTGATADSLHGCVPLADQAGHDEGANNMHRADEGGGGQAPERAHLVEEELAPASSWPSTFQ